ncbi:MAG: hypothetical protein QXG10_01320 [Candidatus Hadarchaeales archaeon]
MDITVMPGSSVVGEVEALPSKYLTLIACAVAALGPGKSVIESPLQCKDTSAMLRSCENMGCTVKKSAGRWTVWGVQRDFTPVQNALDLKNSGTAISLMCGVASLSKIPLVLTGDSDLCRRPMPEMLESLRRTGATVYSTKQDEGPPFIAFGGGVSGGKADLRDLPINVVPPALIISPYADKKTRIIVPSDREKFTIEDTLDIMKNAGVSASKSGNTITVPQGTYRGMTYRVRKEICSAAPFITSSAILGSKITVTGCEKPSRRDELFMKTMGAFGIRLKRRGAKVGVERDMLKGARIDLAWGPELFPFFAVIGCYARGTTRISGINAARRMKSDRVSSMVRELKKLGAKIMDDGTSVVIQGPCRIKGGEVQSWNDYAVTSALAAAATGGDEKIVIKGGADCMGTTYSKFISAFKALGAEMSYSG